MTTTTPLRAAAAVCLAGALTLTAAACGDDGSTGGGSEGKGAGSITFWDNNGGVRTPVWKEIIADFEKAHPDIDVEYVPIPINDVQSKYDTAIAGGGCRTSAASPPRTSRTWSRRTRWSPSAAGSRTAR